MHDEANFENPFAFKPERYLNEDGTMNPKVLGSENGYFGYGPRSVSLMVLDLTTFNKIFHVESVLGVT